MVSAVVRLCAYGMAQTAGKLPIYLYIRVQVLLVVYQARTSVARGRCNKTAKTCLHSDVPSVVDDIALPDDTPSPDDTPMPGDTKFVLAGGINEANDAAAMTAAAEWILTHAAGRPTRIGRRSRSELQQMKQDRCAVKPRHGRGRDRLLRRQRRHGTRRRS